MKTMLEMKPAAIMAFLLLLVFTLPAGSQDFGASMPDMQNLDLIDQGVEKEMAVAKDILGLQWAWQYTQSSEDHRLTPKKVGNYTLLLDQKNVAAVKVDCNRAHGTYTLEGNHLQFEISAMTRAMCPDPEMDNSFLRDINLVEFYNIENELLILKLKDKETLMVFEPLTEPAGNSAE
jgi:heat shock protein HslJ